MVRKDDDANDEEMAATSEETNAIQDDAGVDKPDDNDDATIGDSEGIKDVASTEKEDSESIDSPRGNIPSRLKRAFRTVVIVAVLVFVSPFVVDELEGRVSFEPAPKIRANEKNLTL